MSSPPGNFDLDIYQGATYTQVFTWLSGVCCGSSTAGATQQPVDLTGYTASMQIRAYALSPTVEYDATSNLVLGGTLGTITLTIPASATEGFTWWSGVYDLLLTDSAGNVTPFLRGNVTVTPGVTMPSFGSPVLNDAGQNVQTDAGNQVNTSS